MNKQRQGRLIKTAGMLIAVGISTLFILYALRQNISLYYTPTQLTHAKLLPHQIIRIGAKVMPNSIHYFSNSTKVLFTIADKKNKVIINYHGLLPTLFRVGQTVVVQGYIEHNGIFRADQVLAKHGANYHR